MRGSDAPAVDDHDTPLEGFVERRDAGRSLHSLQEVRRRLRRHGDDDEAPARVAAKSSEVVADERLDLRRDREWFAWRRLDTPSDERSADLEAKEWVAATCLMEADEQRARMGLVETFVHQPTERPDGQWPKVDPLPSFDGHDEPVVGHRGTGLITASICSSGASGEDEADRLRPQPAACERERSSAGDIGPLNIIDRDDDRPLGRQDPQDVGHGQSDEGGIRGPRSGLDATQRRLEGAASGLGEPPEKRGIGRLIEQGDQCGEGEVALGDACAPRQHVTTALRRPVDGVRPEGALADAGLAVDQQRGGTIPLKPPFDRTAFGFAADHLRAGHRLPSCRRS
jgi:hypothetical protein